MLNWEYFRKSYLSLFLNLLLHGSRFFILRSYPTSGIILSLPTEHKISKKNLRNRKVSYKFVTD